jgi:L-lactate dehydrogenase complex protein LldG
MGSVVSPALFGLSEFGQLARASSLCGACKEACPVDIDLPKLLLRVRAGIGPDGSKNKPNAPVPLSMGLSAYSMATSSPRRFAMAQWLAGIFGSLATIFHQRDPWISLPAFSGWGHSKDFPAPAVKPFHARYKKRIQSIEVETGSAEATKDIPVANTPEVDGVTELSEDHLVLNFAAELEALGGHFISCARDEVIPSVMRILRERGIDIILTWSTPHLPETIQNGLSMEGIKVSYPSIETIEADRHVHAGLTGATAAIANTGSLLILGGAGQSLLASLLPEVHIAIVDEKDIFDDLAPVLQREELKQASAAVLITGPSRTADIEMTLTLGVHGPGELHVLCIRRDGKAGKPNY